VAAAKEKHIQAQKAVDNYRASKREAQSGPHFKKSNASHRQAVAKVVMGAIKTVKALSKEWGEDPQQHLRLLADNLDMETKSVWNLFQTLEKLKALSEGQSPPSIGEF
jgi:hypothetical protein